MTSFLLCGRYDKMMSDASREHYSCLDEYTTVLHCYHNSSML